MDATLPISPTLRPAGVWSWPAGTGIRSAPTYRRCQRPACPPAALHAGLSCLRQFHRFLARSGVRARRPDRPARSAAPARHPAETFCPKMRWPRCSGRHPSCPARRGLLAEAALEILYSTGLRVSEMLGLKRAALAVTGEILFVRGKGGRERIVPLSEAARIAAAALVASSPAAQWLFPGRDIRRALTRQGFDKILHDTSLAAGLDPVRRFPARAAPRLCVPYARARGRSAKSATAAGPRRHRDHPNLHPCPHRALAASGGSASSAGAGGRARTAQDDVTAGGHTLSRRRRLPASRNGERDEHPNQSGPDIRQESPLRDRWIGRHRAGGDAAWGGAYRQFRDCRLRDRRRRKGARRRQAVRGR